MTLDNVVSGLVVYPARIHSRVVSLCLTRFRGHKPHDFALMLIENQMEELPFMATENIIMKLVSLGSSPFLFEPAVISMPKASI